MKTNLFKSIVSGRLLLISMFALPLFLTSCEKDKKSETSVTATEAGTVMAQAVDPGTGGLVLQTEFAAGLALTHTNSIYCGVRKDSTIAGQLSGDNRTFQYSLALSRTLTCSNGAPSSYSHTFTGTGNYASPAMTSTGNITGSFTLTGLESGTSQVSLDQDYAYTGTQESHVGTSRTLTSTVTVHSTGVKVDKITRQIVSGTANLNVSGLTSTGEAFNYDGTITFLGGRKATLVVTGGSSANITW
jgi:hypothetical protein